MVNTLMQYHNMNIILAYNGIISIEKKNTSLRRNLGPTMRHVLFLGVHDNLNISMDL